MAFKSTPDITIIITMRARATVGNCVQLACTKMSWENRAKGTVNVIAGCADNRLSLGPGWAETTHLSTHPSFLIEDYWRGSGLR